MLLASLLLWSGCSASEPETANRSVATRISAQAQLIGGPKALGSIGDYLLENDKIRVIVHGPSPNRGTTMYPGMIIDADLQRPEGGDGRGRDQIGEITPAFLFETFNPTRFEVTADGSDGGPAILTVEGVGDDFLGQLSLLSTSLFFPQGLSFKIEYILEPGESYVEIRTTIKNETDTIHPFPFVEPRDFADLGLDIPGIEELDLSVPLGLFAIFGAENKVFAPGPTGFNLRFAVEDSYLEAGGLPAFPGIVAEYVATRADGVSYGLTVPTQDSNYVPHYEQLYEGQKVTDHSLLVPFLFSSVTAVFHTEAPDQLDIGEEFSYSSYLAVGRGDVASVASVVYDIHGIETGRFGGRVIDGQTKAPVERAMVMVRDPQGNYVTELDTDADGNFLGDLPPGEYSYQVITRSRHPSRSYELRVDAGKLSSGLVELAAPANLVVQVRDQEGRALPSKVSLVGRFDEAAKGVDPRDFLYDIALGESVRPTTFDATRNEFIEAAWYSPDGLFQNWVRPGEYELYVSRGSEFDVHKETIQLEAGKYADISVTLKKSVDTAGYVSTDLHLHSKNSVDSGLELGERVVSIAGEGVEYAAATDHNFVTDYEPFIAAHGLSDWLLSSVGVEVTSFEMGHFNGYPLEFDSGSIRGGDVVWAGETPQSIFDQLRSLGKYGPEETIVQVNHPRWEFLGYFNVFNLSQDQGVPEERTGLLSVFAPIGEEYELDKFSLDFEVVEMLNGKRIDLLHTFRVPEELPPPPLPEEIPPAGTVLRNDDGSVAFPGAMEDWFVLLNQGVRFTGIGSSDSHRTLGDEPGWPRTFVFVGEDKDGQGQFTEKDVVRGLRSGRAVISMGPFIDARINGEPIGSQLTDRDGSVELSIAVESPNFAPVDRIKVFSNGEIIIDEPIPAANAHAYTVVKTIEISEDSWFIVEVTGSENLFPVVTPSEFEPLSPDAVISGLGASFDLSALQPFGNLFPSETFAITPVAITNPIFVDVDGNGDFDPSLGSGLGTQRAQPRRERQDLREIFEQIPEVL